MKELIQLVRDLHELLEGYAPWWSIKGMDIRVSKGQVHPAKKISARQYKSERPGFFASLRDSGDAKAKVNNDLTLINGKKEQLL